MELQQIVVETMKDAISCDKLRRGANTVIIRRSPNGETQYRKVLS